MKTWNQTAGSSAPLGAAARPDGVNFSVFSRSATAIELLLFDDAQAGEPSRIVALDPRSHRTYHYWHAFVPDLFFQLSPSHVSTPGSPGRGTV